MLDPLMVGVMLAIGMLLGFVGLGGAGVVAAILVAIFGLPVHLSFATALGAMFVAAATGGWSHLREGNVDPVIAVQVGVVGMVGAYLGGGLALATGATELKTLAGLTLLFNSLLVYLRTRMPVQGTRVNKYLPFAERWWKELPGSTLLGMITGVITGFLSIGAAPWVQMGLMVVKGTSLRVTIGTTMVAVALMSLTATIRYALAGQFDLWLLASVTLGMSTGTFLGAKLTRRSPRWLVRWALVVTPFAAGMLMTFGPAAG